MILTTPDERKRAYTSERVGAIRFGVEHRVISR